MSTFPVRCTLSNCVTMLQVDPHPIHKDEMRQHHTGMAWVQKHVVKEQQTQDYARVCGLGTVSTQKLRIHRRPPASHWVWGGKRRGAPAPKPWGVVRGLQGEGSEGSSGRRRGKRESLRVKGGEACHVPRPHRYFPPSMHTRWRTKVPTKRPSSQRCNLRHQWSARRHWEMRRVSHVRRAKKHAS